MTDEIISSWPMAIDRLAKDRGVELPETSDLGMGVVSWQSASHRRRVSLKQWLVNSAVTEVTPVEISFWMDVKCFFGTIVSVVKHDGVVEGGTGTKKTVASSKETVSK